ncbi:MAG: TIGR02270 family protein [Burkholderiaceae bacterium]
MIATIQPLVAQYAEIIAILWDQRRLAVAGDVDDLATLAEADERMAAHIEGLQVSGAAGWHEALRALQERLEPGEAFVAAVLALDAGDMAGLQDVLAAVAGTPSAWPGLMSACGWVAPSCLRGIAGEWLASPTAMHRRLGLQACLLHRVEPRQHWDALVEDPEPSIRALALRVAGELGAVHLRDACLARLAQESDAEARPWAAWSAVMLGDRSDGLHALLAQPVEASMEGPFFDLALQVQDPQQAHAWLKRLAGQGTGIRTLLRGSGLVGDPAYVPWLLDQMKDPDNARLAGQSFSLITGAQLEDAALRGAPAVTGEGPSDDANDPAVAMPVDQQLPWPDVQAVTAWWTAHRDRLPAGHRLLNGESLTRAHLLSVLDTGRQRARAMAATALSLQTCGTPRVDVEAPAQRQLEVLAGLKARSA